MGASMVSSTIWPDVLQVALFALTVGDTGVQDPLLELGRPLDERLLTHPVAVDLRRRTASTRS